MAISFPRTDILSPFYFANQSFRLNQRQETSTQANGVVRGKDLGSALWLADYSTVTIPNDDALTLETKLDTLDGVINPFEAGDIRRPYPKAYPSGAFTDSGQLNSVNANNKALSLKLLPAGFVLSIGDYLAFDSGSSRALHKVAESVTANGSGLTAEFEVRPHIRPGWTLSTAVVLKLPKAFFTILPGSISTSTQGAIDSVVSFKAAQYL